MVDFRNLVDYIKAYNPDPKAPLNLQPSAPVLTVGVRIKCDGDVTILGKPRIEETEVIGLHPILREKLIPDIPRRVGLTLLAWKYPVNPLWKDLTGPAFRGPSPFSDLDANLLFMKYDDSADKFSIPEDLRG